jgi:OOP family OmpA-OmpF porin
MKAMYRAALMAVAFVFLLPLSARSEIRAGSFEVGPFAGYNFFQPNQNLENRPVFGLRLGYNFTKHWGIEGAGEYIRTSVDDRGRTNITEGQFGSPMDKVDLTFYHLDAVYHFIPEGNFNPFVVVGFGGAHYKPVISTKDMAAFNVGIGAKYWVADNIALRVDVQDYMVGEIMQETYHNIGVTFGVTFAFGGGAKPEFTPAAQYEIKAEPAPEPKASPTPPPPPEPIAEEKVIILASEPDVEKEVVAAVSETKAEEKVIILVFEDIHFDFDQSSLKPEARTILKRNIQLLKDNPKAHVRIAGYTSASGTYEYNQKLSERRAKAVKDYLINEGLVTKDRLATIGYGEANPETYEVAPKDLYSPAAKSNMRVLFEIILKK